MYQFLNPDTLRYEDEILLVVDKSKSKLHEDVEEKFRKRAKSTNAHKFHDQVEFPRYLVRYNLYPGDYGYVNPRSDWYDDLDNRESVRISRTDPLLHKLICKHKCKILDDGSEVQLWAVKKTLFEQLLAEKRFDYSDDLDDLIPTIPGARLEASNEILRHVDLTIENSLFD